MPVKKFFSKPETTTIAAFAGAAVLLLCFLLIAWGMAGGSLQGADHFIANLMRDPADASEPWGGALVISVVRDISSLGSVVVLLLFSAVAVAYLCLTARLREAGWFVAMISVAGLASNGLKHLFARPRPDLYTPAVDVFTYSFPSAHAMMSATVYLGLGFILAKAHQSRLIKRFFMLLAIGMVVLIGLSRIYLSVHWASDVLAGWIAGALCVLCFRFAENVSGKRRVS